MAKKNGNGRPKDPMSNTKTMANEGMRLIRNIAFGNFNMYNDGHVFRDINFVNATIAEVEKRLFDAQIHVNAMAYAYGACEDPRVVSLRFNDQKRLDAYMLIREVLYGVATTGDTGLLYNLLNKLPKYKYNI